MRIGIDTRPLQEKKPSGVAQYGAALTRSLLSRKAHQYVLFSNAHGRADAPLYAEVAAAAAERSEHRMPNKALNAGFALLGRPRFEELTGDIDAVYMPNLNFIATDKPLVVTVHDLSFLHYPAFFSTKQRLWHRMIRPETLLRRAVAIAAVSRHTKRDIIEMFGIPAEKITVVSPAAGPEFVPQSPAHISAVRTKYHLPEHYFLYLGVIEPRKNLGALIDAFTTLDAEEHLVIAGAKGWLCDEIFRLASRSGRSNRIHFLEYVAQADKPALYSGATAFVYPSFYEGFGMPPLEAMACGTPVIASHATSLGEVVGDAGILIDPYDTAELAEAMRLIASDKQLATAFAERGLERAKNFSWEKSAAALESIFEKIQNH